MNKNLIETLVAKTLEDNNIEIGIDKYYYDIKCLMAKYLILRELYTNEMKLGPITEFTDLIPVPSPIPSSMKERKREQERNPKPSTGKPSTKYELLIDNFIGKFFPSVSNSMKKLGDLDDSATQLSQEAFIYQAFTKKYPKLATVHLYLCQYFFMSHDDSEFNGFIELLTKERMNGVFLRKLSEISSSSSSHSSMDEGTDEGTDGRKSAAKDTPCVDAFIRHITISTWSFNKVHKYKIDRLECDSIYDFLDFLRNLQEVSLLTKNQNSSRYDTYTVCMFFANLLNKMTGLQYLLYDDTIPMREKLYLSIYHQKYDEFLDKNGELFNLLPYGGPITETFLCINSLESVPRNFEKYPAFLGIKLVKKSYATSKFSDVEKRVSHFEEKRFNHEHKNGSVFCSVNDIVLGCFLVHYYNSLKESGPVKSRDEPMWPFSGVVNWLYAILHKNKINDVYNDPTIPIMLPRDIFRLQTMLGLISEPHDRMIFLEKFVKVNFDGKKKLCLFKWAQANKYVSKKKLRESGY